MAFVPRVNRHVAYLLEVTPTYVKRRSARITAITTGTNADLQVGHHGETYADIAERTDPNANDTGVYVTY